MSCLKSAANLLQLTIIDCTFNKLVRNACIARDFNIIDLYFTCFVDTEYFIFHAYLT